MASAQKMALRRPAQKVNQRVADERKYYVFAEKTN